MKNKLKYTILDLLEKRHKSINILSRKGLIFTENEQKIIKNLYEDDKIKECQTIILNKLNKEYK